MAEERTKGKEFRGILTSGTIYQSALSMQSSIASPFLNNKGFTPSQIGVLNSISWGIVGFLSMPCGRLSDVIGRRMPLVLSSLLSMVACILVYFATNVFTALSLYVLMGLSMAFFTPIISALIFEVVEPSKAPVSFALFYLVTLIGASLSSLISGWLSKSFASELPFLVASILFLTSIPIYFVHTGKRSKKGNGWSALTNLIDIKAMLLMLKQNPYLGFYGFSLLFHELGFFMINPYINLFAQQVVGLDMWGVGLVVAIWNIGCAMGFIPWALITAKKGSGKILLMHLLISSPVWAMLALSNNLGSMLFYIFLFGFVGSMDLPARRTLAAELSRGKNLGGAMGFIELSNGLSGMLGGAMGGLLWETLGPTAVFYMSSISTLVSVPLLFIVVKNMNK